RRRRRDRFHPADSAAEHPRGHLVRDRGHALGGGGLHRHERCGPRGRAGGVTGMLVVGLAMIGIAGYYGILTWIAGESQRYAVDALIGLGFGGSLISGFAR